MRRDGGGNAMSRTPVVCSITCPRDVLMQARALEATRRELEAKAADAAYTLSMRVIDESIARAEA